MIYLIRIACFTAKETNIPMWTRYAKEHIGVCVEYDTESIKKELTLNSLYPIRYTEKLLDGMSHGQARQSSKCIFIFGGIRSSKA